MTYLDDFHGIINEFGYGPVFFFGIDDSVVNGISINPYGGLELDNIVSSERPVIHSDVQVFIRNSSAETGFSQALNIYNKLRGTANSLIGNTFFLRIVPKAPPMFLFRTDSGNYEFSVNFSLIFRE